jgi:hypothetical protein
MKWKDDKNLGCIIFTRVGQAELKQDNIKMDLCRINRYIDVHH